VIVTYKEGATDEEYGAYLQELSTLVAQIAGRYERIGQVHDATAWARSTAKQRQMQADWVKQHFDFLRNRGGFSAFVFKSAFIRGGLTAVMWLVPMPGPHFVAATLQEALHWITPQVGGERAAAGGDPRGRLPQ